MTISTSASAVTLEGNGITTSFSYNFLIPYLSDRVTPAVNVYYTDATGVTTLLSPSAYSISGVGNSSGGSITYNPGSPIATGTYLSIIRMVPYTQPTAVPNQAFYPNTIEQVADNLELQLQQLKTNIAFTMQFPQTDPTAPSALPSAVLRANMVLGFDVSGNVEMVDLNSMIANLRNQINTNAANISTLTSEVNTLNSEMATAISNINTLLGDVTTIDTQITNIGQNLSRCYQAPSSDSAFQTTLPIAAQRAGKVFGFDSTGQPTMVTPGGPTSPAIQYFNTNQTAVAGWDGNVLTFDASAGPLTLTVPKSLGGPGGAFSVTVERSPADTSSNVIQIVDETAAYCDAIISPVAAGRVPSLVIRTDGSYLTSRGIG